PQDEEWSSLFDGVHPEQYETSEHTGIAEAAAIASNLDGTELGRSEIAERIAALLGPPRKGRPESVHLTRALAEALGFKFEAYCDDAFVTAGEPAKIILRAANTGPLRLHLNRFKFSAESPEWILPEISVQKELPRGAAEEASAEISAKEN